MYRFKDTGGSRDTRQTHQHANQDPGTHASPQTHKGQTAPLTRSSSVVVTVVATAPSYGTSSHSLYNQSSQVKSSQVKSLYNQGADHVTSQRPTRCEYRPCLPTRTLIAFAQELSRPAKRQSLAKFV